MLQSFAAHAEIVLDSQVRDQLIIQRGSIWEVSGTATSRDDFVLKFAGQEVHVHPSAGTWMARVPVPSHLAGTTRLVIDRIGVMKEVAVGDIWVCGGQSNMALPLRRAADQEDIANDVDGKPIYVFRAPRPAEAMRARKGQWMAATPDTVSKISAVCLAFGASLYQRIGVPIGLIDASLAGASIESWLSAESFGEVSSATQAKRRFQQHSKRREAAGRRRNAGLGKEEPSELFNLMIAGLRKQPIRGVLWYQGESNVQQAYDYAEWLEMLMKDWRKNWGSPSLPFVVMQLPGIGKSGEGFDRGSRWARVRDAQRLAVSSSQPAGLVVTVDLGDGTPHPKVKGAFGRRAAEVAYDLVYGQGPDRRVPMITSVEFQGTAVRVQFSACIRGTRKASRTVFVAGNNGEWRNATVSVDQSTITARSPELGVPVALRYGWSDYPEVGLVSCDGGMPVTPFRTDNWPTAPGEDSGN